MSDLRKEQLEVFSTMFIRTDAGGFEECTSAPLWDAFVSGASHDLALAIAQPPSYDDYRHYMNRILTPGIPGSLPLVESLYKDWGGRSAGLQHGQGYYLGESAQHARAVFDSLGIEIPHEYESMPDHLVLLLELFEYLRDNASAQDAADFARHHFDWLVDYRQALATRMENENDASLVEVAQFYRHLLSYVEEFVSSDVLMVKRMKSLAILMRT